MWEINKMSHSLPSSFLKDWEASTQAGCKKMCNVKCITLSRNQCGRVPFPSVRILIFLRGAISAISIMKLSSWPRSNLKELKDRGGFPFALQQHCPLIPCPCCYSHLANNLKLKAYEWTSSDFSSPVLQSPATMFLARHLSLDSFSEGFLLPWKMKPIRGNWSLPRQSVAYVITLFAIRTIETCSQVSACHLPPGICPCALLLAHPS